MNYTDIKTFEERRKENLGRPRHYLDREEIAELRAYIVGHKDDSNRMNVKELNKVLNKVRWRDAAWDAYAIAKIAADEAYDAARYATDEAYDAAAKES